MTTPTLAEVQCSLPPEGAQFALGSGPSRERTPTLAEVQCSLPPEGAQSVPRGGPAGPTKAALALLLALWTVLASALEAPNVVAISDQLVTSGQPNEKSLASLREQGFTAVVYLVPTTGKDLIPREREIVREQGIAFEKVPIQWQEPTEADYAAFAAAMKRAPQGKVLVHCQINLQASSMTFLYRVIALREPPDKAYESVAAVWSPNPVWKRYLAAELARAGVAFEPY
jgi:protein tyrosine phosphatase (PTP) superfamily phosphohydrolase (DUF442 family)